MKTIQGYDQVADDFSLIEMCGRMVQVKKRKQGELALTRNKNGCDVDVLGTACADCLTKAPFIIKELHSDFTWCYCGVCSVGG